VKPSANWAPKVFEGEPDADGFTKRAFDAAMKRLLNAGRIRVEITGPTSRQRGRIVRIAA
jgi:hypothetical protein